MRVLVAAGDASAQYCVALDLAEGASVADALSLAMSTEPALVAHVQPETAVGVWGRVARRDRLLREGDRVEIYRAIQADAKAMRRSRAAVSSSPRRRSEP